MEEPSVRLRKLIDYADEGVKVDYSKKAIHYLRSGAQMEKMANVYFEEGNLEAAYILYSKFVLLFVEKLPNHPQYKFPDLAKEKAKNKRILKEVAFPRAEELKKRLREEYEAVYKKWHAEEQEKNERAEAEKMRVEEEYRKELALKEQQVQLALEEQQERLAVARREEEECRRRREEELRRQREMEDAAGASQAAASYSVGGSALSSYAAVSSGVSPYVPVQTVGQSTPDSSLTSSSLPPYNPPQMPQASGPPVFDRSLKPDLSSPSHACAPNGLRWVKIPARLPMQFLEKASENTRANLETCGILAGALKQNVFQITHVILPKQSGTADSCTTKNEEEIFDVQDQYSLMSLGWIHTHPSQTSFLSSIDLHTHCSYQMMLDEAIAIVCAPKYSQTGIYSLTRPHGMQLISQCQVSSFHPHPNNPPLFEDSSHAVIDTALSATFIDLR